MSEEHRDIVVRATYAHLEEVGAVGVRPMQIVDRDEDRTPVAEPNEQLTERFHAATAQLGHVEPMGRRTAVEGLDGTEHLLGPGAFAVGVGREDPAHDALFVNQDGGREGDVAAPARRVPVEDAEFIEKQAQEVVKQLLRGLKVHIPNTGRAGTSWAGSHFVPYGKGLVHWDGRHKRNRPLRNGSTSAALGHWRTWSCAVTPMKNASVKPARPSMRSSVVSTSSARC